MIRKIIDFMRLSFISPECLVIAVCLLAYAYWPLIFVKVGLWLSNEQIWLYLAGIVAIPIMSFATSKEILFPGSAVKNKKILKWPDYYKLKSRVLFSVILSSLCSVAYLVLWVFKNDLSTLLCGFYLVMIFSITFVSFLSLIFASWNIKEIVSEIL